MRWLVAALALVAPTASALPPRAAHTAPTSPPTWSSPDAPARICDLQPVPVAFDFRCTDSTFEARPPHPSLDNHAALEGLLALLRDASGIEAVILRGHQSHAGPERELPITLSQQRADAVARALARSYPAARIHPLASGYAGGTAEPDTCPPPDADTGHPHRRVSVEVIRCADPREHEWRSYGTGDPPLE